MQLSNNHIKELRRLHQKKYRRAMQLFLIEGLRLCEEALKAQIDIEKLIVWPEKTTTPRAQNILNSAHDKNIPIFEATQKQLQSIAMTKSPSGFVAVVKRKKTPLIEEALENSSLLLALDGISDPGNLGTILRTACWFGVNYVFLSTGCVEAHNEKTVRSAMGAHFYMHLYEEIDLVNILQKCKTMGFRVLSAVLEKATPLASLSAANKNIVIIGNEAHGINPTLMNLVDHGITIPRLGYGESLNAAIAAGIILYELTRKN